MSREIVRATFGSRSTVLSTELLQGSQSNTASKHDADGIITLAQSSHSHSFHATWVRRSEPADSLVHLGA
jgi:hypothetical protein